MEDPGGGDKSEHGGWSHPFFNEEAGKYKFDEIFSVGAMCYEIHGTGQPLVLIHGGLSATETSFGKLLPPLAKTRQVIAVELQAHGRTGDIDRPLRYEFLADDTAALLEPIGIEKAITVVYKAEWLASMITGFLDGQHLMNVPKK